jgi:hypothetical protein
MTCKTRGSISLSRDLTDFFSPAYVYLRRLSLLHTSVRIFKEVIPASGQLAVHIPHCMHIETLLCFRSTIKFTPLRFDTAAKKHKTHKNNNLHIGISNSYGLKKYKFGLFTRPSRFVTKSIILYFYRARPEISRKYSQ